ncbi:CLUMA_CG005282, isoform A [Clunio marinus]|uniref:CLUMA_CG005282, isoform A n=1 Tax=Clunio marinus TaxID=568069 RepID=A0A1J1HYL3_9DIPT|nr:CLUMA_CG005282, isoform A [Clunio marinus]
MSRDKSLKSVSDALLKRHLAQLNLVVGIVVFIHSARGVYGIELSRINKEQSYLTNVYYAKTWFNKLGLMSFLCQKKS